jgi:CheY-like chemotaxis protein
MMELAGEHEKRPSNVTRLQPLRVLLAGRDERFMRVTSFLLSRRGYAVRRSTLVDACVEATRNHSDVVLVDDGGSRVEVARTIAALQALAAAPALLLLSTSGATYAWKRLPVVDKWTPIATLAAEIDKAALHRLPPNAGESAEEGATLL